MPSTYGYLLVLQGKEKKESVLNDPKEQLQMSEPALGKLKAAFI